MLLIELTPLEWIHIWVTKNSKCFTAHTAAVFNSVHENASLLYQVALTGLGLGMYDSMSLYITTSDYFCYSYWFRTTLRQTYLLNYTFKTDFTSIKLATKITYTVQQEGSQPDFQCLGCATKVVSLMNLFSSCE